MQKKNTLLVPFLFACIVLLPIHFNAQYFASFSTGLGNGSKSILDKKIKLSNTGYGLSIKSSKVWRKNWEWSVGFSYMTDIYSYDMDWWTPPNREYKSTIFTQYYFLPIGLRYYFGPTNNLLIGFSAGFGVSYIQDRIYYKDPQGFNHEDVYTGYLKRLNLYEFECGYRMKLNESQAVNFILAYQTKPAGYIYFIPHYGLSLGVFWIKTQFTFKIKHPHKRPNDYS